MGRVDDDIRVHGWHVALVAEDDFSPPFAYTVGLHQRFRSPELIVFGLNDDLAAMHRVLNDLGQRVQAGLRLRADAVDRETLAEFTCVLADVPRAEHRHHLGQAVRHYGAEPFDALQWVWPDPEGHLPWDDDAGPTLQRRQPWVGRVDGVPFPEPWPLAVPRSLLVLVDEPVLHGAPVGVAARAGEEDWAFVAASGREARYPTTLGRLVARQPSLQEVAGLPVGQTSMVSPA